MSAQYGKFKFTVIDPLTGLPISGAAVEIRKQGATVNGLHSGTQTVFTVNDPGAIVLAASDQVAVGISASSLGVTGVTATTITVAGPGFTDVPDDARLTVTNNLPTLYNDAQGAETKTNPLQTDANGLAECWIPLERIDVAIRPTGPAGAVTLLYQDEFPDGVGRTTLHDFAGTAEGMLWKTLRQFTGTDRYLSIRNADNVEDFQFSGNGKFILGKSGSTESCSINGNVNMVGNFAVSSGTLTAGAGFTHTGGSFSVVAGSVTRPALAANAIHPAPSTTTGTSTDVAVGTGETVRITTSYTPVSGNVGCLILVNCPYESDPSTNGGKVLLKLYVGGSLKATGSWGVAEGSGDIASAGTISFAWFEPAMAASPTTIEVRDIKITFKGSTAAVINYAGAASYPGYMTIIEMAK
jgi:hypothetical protein